jgi:hypothetical protein
MLVADFSEKEVREAIFQMKHNKRRGLMVFLLSFIKYFGVS